MNIMLHKKDPYIYLLFKCEKKKKVLVACPHQMPHYNARLKHVLFCLISILKQTVHNTSVRISKYTHYKTQNKKNIQVTAFSRTFGYILVNINLKFFMRIGNQFSKGPKLPRSTQNH